MEEPIVSVITSTYNRSEKLIRAINSVIDQSFEDWEMIVVDDASTDDTEDRVGEIDDDRVKYIKLGKNFGNDTRPKNTGIMTAKGRYIAFLDDDNVYRKDHLQALVSAMEKSNVDCVYGDRFLTVDGEPQGLGVYSEYNPMLLLVRNYIDTSDVLMKRETIFDLGGFDENYKKYIDWNLWVRAAKANKKFQRVPLVLTDYYIDDDSKSKREEDTVNNMPAWNPMDCEVRLDYLGKKEPLKVAIFSLTYDRLEYTKECFDSMYKTAGYPIDVHVIVDNGSKDGTIEWVKEYCKTNDIELEVVNG